MNENADEQLVINCLSGDSGAFDQIVRKYQKTIFNLTYYMIRDYDQAEDLTQNVFVKVYENLNRYNTRYKFYSWIYRIAVNESLNYIKRQKKDEKLQESFESVDAKTDSQAVDEEIFQTIKYALGELEPDYRILIIMRHFLDYSYRDISETLDIPEKTVKSRLYSARQILARILTKKGIIINE